MTTQVKITTVDWPVEVKHIDMDEKGYSTNVVRQVVPPHSETIMHIWDTRGLVVREMKQGEE